MLFSKKKETPPSSLIPPKAGHLSDRSGDQLAGRLLRGSGGIRIEGTITGEIAISGLVVIGETGKVECEQLKADTIIVAGTVQGNITCQKLEIRSTGKVWGDVVTTTFSSEDGAFCAVK